MPKALEKAQNVVCAQCKTSFEVNDGDIQMYDKLSPEIGGKKFQIPLPTLCPECRQRRRMSFRNERQLYRRKCDVTGENIISVFSPENPHKVCEKNYWYSDKFDPLQYGRPYDFSQPFFAQSKKLVMETPLPSLRVELSENCEFNNDMRECSNCYLCSRTHLSKSMMYTYRGNKSNDCIDCMQVTECAYLYECVNCVKCQDSRFLFDCIDCASSSFLLDCRNCTDCFMCCNLRSKRHCFLNEQLTKEAYGKKLQEFDFGSWKMVQLAEKMYKDIRKKAIRRDLLITNCEDVRGDNLVNCKHCHLCFSAQKCQDCRYIWDVKLHRDSMDEYSGGRESELMYETTSGSGSYDVQFCLRAAESQHVRYSFFITSCKNIFGSVGLRRQEYCILNKQYSKEEYEDLVQKIIDETKKDGEYGEFFPASLSPFAYNETAAQEYFPLSQQDAEVLGYSWALNRVRPSGESAYLLPDNIDDIEDDITEQMLSCEQCDKYFKIVPRELALYKERRIPMPRHCVDCRYMRRFHAKNPWKLRPSTCARCKKDIMTSFSEDAPEIVYCESCYLSTVY